MINVGLDFGILGDKLTLALEYYSNRSDDLLMYDAKDLCTHAMCVGMTGSGKTGLCLSLLEEAAIDGVPAICVDPKGDVANLQIGCTAGVDRKGAHDRGGYSGLSGLAAGAPCHGLQWHAGR